MRTSTTSSVNGILRQKARQTSLIRTIRSFMFGMFLCFRKLFLYDNILCHAFVRSEPDMSATMPVRNKKTQSY